MIQTERCRLCGQVLETFIDTAAGIPLTLSRQAIQTKVEAARIRHADSCPARRRLTSPPAKNRSPAQRETASRLGVLARTLRAAVRRLRRPALRRRYDVRRRP